MVNSDRVHLLDILAAHAMSDTAAPSMRGFRAGVPRDDHWLLSTSYNSPTQRV